MATIQVLINNALYKSTNDREFEKIEPGGNRLNVALDILQGLFDEFNYAIPYTQLTTFSDYNDLTNTTYKKVMNVTYFLGDVRYELVQKNRTQYLKIASVADLKSIPEIYFFDELTGTISVYPEPSLSTNDFEVVGLIDFGQVQPTTVIPENMPRFMRDFFEYELARRMCDEYGVQWSESKEATRRDLYRRLRNAQDIDLVPNDIDPFRAPSAGKNGFPYLYYLNGGKG